VLRAPGLAAQLDWTPQFRRVGGTTQHVGADLVQGVRSGTLLSTARNPDLGTPGGQPAIMNGMAISDPKADLLSYLRQGREGFLRKLDGLSDYDARRPMTLTATNILGLVKHVAGVQSGYFGETFGRAFPEQLAWEEVGAEIDDDLWARSDESIEDIVGLFRRSSAHADSTIERLPLDTIGHVPWWPVDRSEVTLHRVLVHVIAEVGRHAGQADIIRELIDGTAGLAQPGNNMPERTAEEWNVYRLKVETAAREASN
jgi:uncharacterized damage-inducible protein DinB